MSTHRERGRSTHRERGRSTHRERGRSTHRERGRSTCVAWLVRRRSVSAERHSGAISSFSSARSRKSWYACTQPPAHEAGRPPSLPPRRSLGATSRHAAIRLGSSRGCGDEAAWRSSVGSSGRAKNRNEQSHAASSADCDQVARVGESMRIYREGQKHLRVRGGVWVGGVGGQNHLPLGDDPELPHELAHVVELRLPQRPLELRDVQRELQQGRGHTTVSRGRTSPTGWSGEGVW